MTDDPFLTRSLERQRVRQRRWLEIASRARGEAEALLRKSPAGFAAGLELPVGPRVERCIRDLADEECRGLEELFSKWDEFWKADLLRRYVTERVEEYPPGAYKPFKGLREKLNYEANVARQKQSVAIPDSQRSQLVRVLVLLLLADEVADRYLPHEEGTMRTDVRRGPPPVSASVVPGLRGRGGELVMGRYPKDRTCRSA